MVDNLEIFNNQIANFMADILKIFPNESRIRLGQEQFKVVRKLGKNLVFNYFVKYVYPYREYIMNNEDKIISEGTNFFLKDDSDENKLMDKIKIAESVSQTKIDKDEVFKEIFNIDNLWKNEMTMQHKKKVLVYFKVLIKLADRILKEYVKTNAKKSS